MYPDMRPQKSAAAVPPVALPTSPATALPPPPEKEPSPETPVSAVREFDPEKDLATTHRRSSWRPQRRASVVAVKAFGLWAADELLVGCHTPSHCLYADVVCAAHFFILKAPALSDAVTSLATVVHRLLRRGSSSASATAFVPAAEWSAAAERHVYGGVDTHTDLHTGTDTGTDDDDDDDRRGGEADGAESHPDRRRRRRSTASLFAQFCIRPPSVATVAKGLMEELARLSVSYFVCHPWTDPDLFQRLNKVPVASLLEGGSRAIVTPRHLPAASGDGSGGGETRFSALSPRDKWRHAIDRVRGDVVVKRLVTRRELVTLIAQMKAMGEAETCRRPKGGSRVGKRRRPVLLMLGGGMGAGKSRVVQNVLRRDDKYDAILKDAVVVEADAFKLLDPVFQRRGEFSSGAGRAVDANIHQRSTAAAETLLLAALASQRNVVFDGTMAWEPFVRQTVAMVRDTHTVYVKGPGYVEHPDGTVTEEYWTPVCDPESIKMRAMESPVAVEDRAPYELHMVGVTCAAEVAVSRGFSRYLATDRPVPTARQIRSHAQFARAFEAYVPLFDCIMLLDTTNIGYPAQLVVHRDVVDGGGSDGAGSGGGGGGGGDGGAGAGAGGGGGCGAGAGADADLPTPASAPLNPAPTLPPPSPELAAAVVHPQLFESFRHLQLVNHKATLATDLYQDFDALRWPVFVADHEGRRRLVERWLHLAHHC